MNEIVCTGITYSDWRKEIRFCIDPVEDTQWVAIISFPRLSNSQINEVQTATIDRVQEILSKLF